MKNLILSFCSLLLLSISISCYAQKITPEKAAEMARRIRSMTPSQMLKFRDSLMNAVLTKQAAIRPNGDLMLKKHLYGTSFTTVAFSYIKATAGHAGFFAYSCHGTSGKAPMMYEGNGHTMIQCSFNPMAAGMKNETAPVDNAAAALKSKTPYMSAVQASDAGSLSAQMAFSSEVVKDNSVKGGATFNEPHVSIKSVDNIGFSFNYDPQQHISTISVGASLTIDREIKYGDAFVAYIQQASVGGAATTDVTEATIAGGGPTKSKPGAAYAKVTKTPNGFNISYVKITHNLLGDVTETINATIGEPVLDYEAIIKPYNFNYEHWLPKGPKVDGSDDKKGDDSCRFYLFVQDKTDPTKQYPGNFTVKWMLKDVTKYQGFCSNYPLMSQHPDKKLDLLISDTMKTDIHFAGSSVTESQVSSKKDDGLLAVLRVMCMDYGAWGKLYAEVTLDDGTVLNARPYYKRDGAYLTIPFDEDENKIADAWEAKEHISHKGYGLDWDEDVKPDNGHPGDNIALIDEYRGFLTEDNSYKPVYTRFSPGQKELITLSVETPYGQTYKDAIRIGAMGYAHATSVKVYHLTKEMYALAEPGIQARYPRWVNWNSPLENHTVAVIIDAFSRPSPRNDPQVLGSTKGLWALDPIGYNGAQVPKKTDECFIWAYDIVLHNDAIVHGTTWFLPARAEGHDSWNITVNSYVKHANEKFHSNMDTLTLSNVVGPAMSSNVARLISNTVAHEICHATNVNHHHFSHGDGGPYAGVSTCPLRYWMDPLQEDDHAEWMMMFLAGKWDPGSATTPYGMSMTLCKTDDDCFHKLKLK